MQIFISFFFDFTLICRSLNAIYYECQAHEQAALFLTMQIIDRPVFRNTFFGIELAFQIIFYCYQFADMRPSQFVRCLEICSRFVR